MSYDPNTIPNRPTKPRADFPLFAHPNGQWCRKHKAKPYYFGSWRDDPKGGAALRDWLLRKDGIEAGMDGLRVTGKTPALTLTELVGKYMAVRQTDLLAGHLADETFEDYRTELDKFVAHVGAGAQVSKMTPTVFASFAAVLIEERKLGVHAMKRVTAYVKAMFNYAAREGWIAAVNFGNSFKAPDTSPEAIAQTKIRAGEDGEEPIYTETQITALLSKATPAMTAMILLGVNCGFGPSDLARLKWSDIDFTTGRLTNKRGKTGIRREAYLWHRTRSALLALHRRDGLIFHTKTGRPVVGKQRVVKEKDGKKFVVRIKTTNAIAHPFNQLLEDVGVTGLTFYNFRHTYRTHADNNRDSNAVSRTMGHALTGMARRYVRRPFRLKRLKRVALTARRYMFPEEAKKRKEQRTAAVAAGVQPLHQGMRLAQ